MSILVFVFVLFVAIVIFGLSIIGFVLKTLFKIGRRPSSSHQQQAGAGYTRKQEQQQSRNPENNEEETLSDTGTGKKHKKIFTKNDGEYVDFEEIP